MPAIAAAVIPIDQKILGLLFVSTDSLTSINGVGL